jgi:subtilisin family serine protease
MVHPNVESALDTYGFSQVLVVLKEPEVVAAAAANGGASRALGHFLSQPPAPVVGTLAAGGMTLAARKTRTRRGAPTQREMEEVDVPAVKHFARLGVAVGYVDRGGARALDSDDAVESVYQAEPLSMIRPVVVGAAAAKSRLTWGLRKLRVEWFWKQGLTGAGVRVGHLDTGVDGRHIALRTRVVSWAEFGPFGDEVPNSDPWDSDDHGTHVAGTICGGKVGGMSIGVAPDAELCAAMVIEGGNALLRVLAGMEWALAQQVRILNMSLGFRGFSPFFEDVVRRLRERNVLPVFAIGNEGAGTSRSPGNYPEALSVGMTDRGNLVDPDSSSITFNRPLEPSQPNIVAPGVSVVSARPGGGVQSMTGTSMATPHVAGVAALLLQAKPQATAVDVEQAIQSTCTLLTGQLPVRYGFGLINPRAALEALV